MRGKLEQLLVAIGAVAWAGAASAQGLSRARSVLETFRGKVLSIIPVIAVIALIILAVLWGLKAIRFVDLARWGGGVLLVGCATQIVAMLMS